MREVDEAVAPKLRDRVDLWVAKFDPAGVRVPPKIDDNRYVDIVPSPGMAAISGYVRAADGAALDSGWMRWRPPYVRTIRAPKSSAAPMRAGRWRAVRPRWPASAAPMMPGGRRADAAAASGHSRAG